MYLRSISRKSSRACDARCSRFARVGSSRDRTTALPAAADSVSARSLPSADSHFLVGEAKRRAEIAHLREDLVLPALERNDVVSNTEGFEVPSLGHTPRLPASSPPRRPRPSLRSMRSGTSWPADRDRPRSSIDERGEHLGVGSGADQARRRWYSAAEALRAAPASRRWDRSRTAKDSRPLRASRAATSSSTGRLVRICTSVRNGRADSGWELMIGALDAFGAVVVAGVISTRAVARYSAGRSHTNVTLAPSATIRVARKTASRRRFDAMRSRRVVAVAQASRRCRGSTDG